MSLKQFRDMRLYAGLPQMEVHGPCEGHVSVPEERYEQLRSRYGENPIGFVAELGKKNYERKMMHEMLTTAGVPSQTEQGRELCLLARLAILCDRTAPKTKYHSQPIYGGPDTTGF